MASIRRQNNIIVASWGSEERQGWVQIPSTLLGQVTQVLSSLFPYLEKWGDMELIEIIYINQYILTTK